MAFWVVRKGCVPDILPSYEHDSYKREHTKHPARKRHSGGSFDHDEPDHVFAKRARFDHRGHSHLAVFEHNQHDVSHAHAYARGEMVMTTTHNPPFIVIREHASSPELSFLRHHDEQHPPPQAHVHLLNPVQSFPVLMERTASGHSISSSDSPPPEEPSSLLSDSAAAQLVHKHLSSVNRHARHARILRALVYPKTPSRSRDFTIDDDALESIFSAANDVFFAHKLRGRVNWDWSHPDMASAGRYDCAIVGTTALRKRRGPKGGYETLIVLSSPILKDTKYNRRLLISTFLHEMIHSFLFVMCGRKAGINGGHTEGFRKIAADIDDWVGRECLRLTDMEADLDRFTVDEQCDLDSHVTRSQDFVTFTELDGHRKNHDDQEFELSQQQHYHHHNHNHNHQHQHHHDHTQQHSQPSLRQGYGRVHYDELNPSPGYSSAGSYGQHDIHGSHQDHGVEDWQWQRREGFGAPHGAHER